MSVKVDLATLADTMAEHDFAYLLTVSDDHRPHAVAVQPALRDGTLALDGLGNRTRTNLAERPAVTLVFPPREPGGYSLIVDGEASQDGDGALVLPAHAVLHRPADHAGDRDAAASGSSCGNDCLPL
jgi:hypothetical protein